MKGRFDGFVLLENLPSAGEVRNITIRPFLSTAPSEKEFREMFGGARTVAPDDPMLENWSYSPWCSIDFDAPDGRYHMQLFLGGLARLECPDGSRGMLMIMLE